MVAELSPTELKQTFQGLSLDIMSRITCDGEASA